MFFVSLIADSMNSDRHGSQNVSKNKKSMYVTLRSFHLFNINQMYRADYCLKHFNLFIDVYCSALRLIRVKVSK